MSGFGAQIDWPSPEHLPDFAAAIAVTAGLPRPPRDREGTSRPGRTPSIKGLRGAQCGSGAKREGGPEGPGLSRRKGRPLNPAGMLRHAPVDRPAKLSRGHRVSERGRAYSSVIVCL
jgi:hypothetical protein